MSVTVAPTAKRDWLSQLCANDVGWCIDYPFSILSLHDRRHVCSIYTGPWFSDHVPFKLETAA